MDDLRVQRGAQRLRREVAHQHRSAVFTAREGHLGESHFEPVGGRTGGRGEHHHLIHAGRHIFRIHPYRHACGIFAVRLRAAAVAVRLSVGLEEVQRGLFTTIRQVHPGRQARGAHWNVDEVTRGTTRSQRFAGLEGLCQLPGDHDGIDQSQHRTGQRIVRGTRPHRPDVQARRPELARIVRQRGGRGSTAKVHSLRSVNPGRVRRQKKARRGLATDGADGKALDGVRRGSEPRPAVGGGRPGLIGSVGERPHPIDARLMPAQEPPVRRGDVRNPGALIHRCRTGHRARRGEQSPLELHGARGRALLEQSRLEQGGRAGKLGRRHTGPTRDLLPGVPRRHVREGDPRSAKIGLGQLTAPGAPPADHAGWRRRDRVRRLGKHPGKQGAGGEREVRRAGEPHRGKAGPVVTGADHEKHPGVLQLELVHQRIDRGVALELVTHSEAQVEHQRESAPLRIVRGEVHGPQHTAGHGDAAAGVVRDLEAQQLRTRCDPVEAAHPEHVVTGRNAGDVTAVSGVIEEEIEDRAAPFLAQVHGDGKPAAPTFAGWRLRGVGEDLPGHAVIVEWDIVVQRTVAVDVGHREPPGAGPGHDHRILVGIQAVAVEIGRRERSQGPLAQDAPVKGRRRESRHATEAFHQSPVHRQGSVRRRGHRFEFDPSLTGEIPEVEELGLVGRRHSEAGQARVDPAVQNPDDDPAAVRVRVLEPEGVGSDRAKRHQPREVCDLWRQDRVALRNDLRGLGRSGRRWQDDRGDRRRVHRRRP